jgi:hypothetical protein
MIRRFSGTVKQNTAVTTFLLPVGLAVPVFFQFLQKRTLETADRGREIRTDYSEWNSNVKCQEEREGRGGKKEGGKKKGGSGTTDGEMSDTWKKEEERKGMRE